MITLNIQFNDKMFPEGQFHEWIIVSLFIDLKLKPYNVRLVIQCVQNVGLRVMVN
jgi:hypothetical protein